MLALRDIDKWPDIRHVTDKSGREVLDAFEDGAPKSQLKEAVEALVFHFDTATRSSDYASQVLHACTRGLTQMALHPDYQDIPLENVIAKAFEHTDNDPMKAHLGWKERVLQSIFNATKKTAEPQSRDRAAYLFDLLKKADQEASQILIPRLW